ncbi:sodium/proton antiporter, CPA1 family [Mariprofundus ferrinatatus]|uniref:Sodium/proton antiporter, CPA1 family n=1 Tax=Mariprofundus ferrinatatus TaxID=1921087 RepID=A0A2K8L5S3_9PROT|nr:cation:proton antiporter [Mariprofundus ferrinatatus]ATX81201.1 sodium/proton antiporter, CPA1 family [Mariprofundus ferrinatatus]
MFPETASPTTTFVIAVLIATAAQMLASRFRFPPILLWLLAGMALGPFGLHAMHVETIEAALHTLIELGLAIILFEGGLSLNLKELRANGWVVGRMVIFGPLLTILIGATVANMMTGIDWPLALLFGALVSVGGPTVILPIIRQMRLGRKISHVLTAEAMLIDVVGAILAIVFLQLALTPDIPNLIVAQEILLKIVVGFFIGLAGGRLLAMLLSSEWSRDVEIRTILTLSSVWGVFLLSDSISSQAGLLAVLMMGATLQRMEVHDIQRLKHFKGSLSMLLISVLFVLLAAHMDLGVMVDYLYPGLLIFAILVFYARPLAILLSTFGSHLSFNESLYLAGMAPRGVVAAGITSLFALILKENGNPQSDMLVALVYIIIISSVLGYSLFARPLKKLLSIDGGDERSVLIVGGGQIGAELGRALGEDREVRFLDLNSEVVTSLQRSGYNAICGNALDPLFWEIIHAEEIGAVIVMTGSSDHNLLIARLASENFHTPEIYVALQEDGAEKHSNLIHQLQARRLFAKPYNFTYWNDQAYRKRLLFESRFIEEDSRLIGEKMCDVRIPHGVQPIAIVREGKTLIPHDNLKFAAGDEIKVLMRPDRMQEGQPLILPPASKLQEEPKDA